MRVILSAAARAAARDAAVAFVTLALGIWAAPDLNQAYALAGAASIAALIAAVRAVRVFAPGIAEGLADFLGIPVAYAEVVITGLTTLIVGFLAIVEGIASAPDLDAARAAGLAGILAVGTALTRIVQAFLTPGEGPVAGFGIKPPPQAIAPASLPEIR